MANQKILRYGTANQWMIVMDGDRGIAPGGFNRQVLTKLSGTDYDAQWRDPAGFTFTQGVAPTVGLDTTSALVTGQTWFDTTTGNGYVRVATSWVQFAWGDSESRYVNAVGDTMSGQLTLNGGGGETMELRPGAADHVYIEFFARTANPASRSAYLGFPAAGSTTFTIANSLPGDIALSPSTGRVALNADPTSALHAATKQYVDAQVATAAANANTRVAKTGDSMTGTLNMGTATKLVFNDELGQRIQLYSGYSIGIESSVMRYISNGTHQFTGGIGTNGRIDAAGHIVANSALYANLSSNGARHGCWVGDWGGGRGDGWSGLVGSRGYILIGYGDGSAGNMHVRGGTTLYVGGNGADQLVINNGGVTCTTNFSAAGLTTIGAWSSNGNYCAIMGQYGYHLLGGGGANDGAIHTRGNNAGYDHYIAAGSYINFESWCKPNLPGGTGGTAQVNLAGVLCNAGSRRILKDEINPLPDTFDAGAVIDALEPVTFIWKKKDDPTSQFHALRRAHMETPYEGEYGPVHITEEQAAAVPHFDEEAAELWRKADLRVGLIADDVAVVRPELANWEWEKDENGNPTDELIPGSWNEQALISVLLQGVKDLRARVAVLEA